MTDEQIIEYLLGLFYPDTGCRTYWGSHGCMLPRGHGGGCVCVCALEDAGQYDPVTMVYYDEPDCIMVGAPPYYGPETSFYGEDAP